LATRSEMVTSAEATWDHIRGESGEELKKDGPMHTLWWRHQHNQIQYGKYTRQRIQPDHSHWGYGNTCSWCQLCTYCSQYILYKTIITT
jgi:Ni/Co efflux regulator RcnB